MCGACVLGVGSGRRVTRGWECVVLMYWGWGVAEERVGGGKVWWLCTGGGEWQKGS
jgi:hypothetical protein